MLPQLVLLELILETISNCPATCNEVKNLDVINVNKGGKAFYIAAIILFVQREQAPQQRIGNT